MGLPTSGAISLNQIHIEAGGTTGTAASINDTDIRALIGKSSGVAMSFSEWYGAGEQYSIVSPVYYWLVNNSGSYVYWNDTYITSAAANATSVSSGGYTYSRETLYDQVSDKSGTTYYYGISRV